MIKKYITILDNGLSEKKAHILGRTITLRQGEIVNESIVTKTFSSYFQELKEDEVKALEQGQQMLFDDSSNVDGQMFIETAVHTKSNTSDEETQEVLPEVVEERPKTRGRKPQTANKA